MPHLS